MLIDKFVGDLYVKSLKQANFDKNLALGPVSIYTALLLTSAGAKNKTRDEILKSMRIDLKLNDVEICEKANELFMFGFNQNISDGPELVSANRVYVAEKFSIKEDYIEHLKNCYKVIAKNVKFHTNAAEIAGEANDFVRTTTKDKIKSIISPDDLDGLTVMLLVNAIYFKGSWKEHFDRLFDGHFTKLNSNNVAVTMMGDTINRKVSYFETDSYQVIYIPFNNTEMKMTFLLPKDKAGLPQMIHQLFDRDKEMKEFISILENSDSTPIKVEITMPKFEISTGLALKNLLVEMGIVDAFEITADFTNIGFEGIYLSQIFHQAYLKVDEKGAEAAASTGVLLQARCAMPVIKFIADHPFMFMIINEKKVPLFIGHVTDPSENN